MMRFDPKEYEKENTKKPSGDGERRQYKQVGPGLKTLHGLTHERWEARSGTKMLKVWFVILKDHTKNGDDGEVIARNFALTPKAMFLWSRFCKALGYEKAHDLSSDSDVADIIGYKAVNSELVANEYNGKTTYQPDNFAAYEGKEGSDWDDVIERGRVSVERIQAKIAEKRASNSSGGYESSYTPPVDNSDIPF
jgi:hypothetical protein